MITKQYQVTIYNKNNQYKPISTIVTIRQEDNTKTLKDIQYKQEIIAKGVNKICCKKYWTNNELKQYEYTTVKVREYNQAGN